MLQRCVVCATADYTVYRSLLAIRSLCYKAQAICRRLDRNNICCCEAVYTVILYWFSHRWLTASGPVTTLAGQCFSCAPPFSLLCHLVHRLHAVNASKPMNLGSRDIIDSCIACFLCILLTQLYNDLLRVIMAHPNDNLLCTAATWQLFDIR